MSHGRRLSLTVLALVGLAVPLVFLELDDAKLRGMTVEELIYRVDERRRPLGRVMTLLVPHAQTNDDACRALIHGLCAGAGPPIYEPAAEALEDVGAPALPLLLEAIQHRDGWVVRYAVIMLGRMARPGGTEAGVLRSMLRAGITGDGYGIERSIQAALREIDHRD